MGHEAQVKGLAYLRVFVGALLRTKDRQQFIGQQKCELRLVGGKGDACVIEIALPIGRSLGGKSVAGPLLVRPGEQHLRAIHDGYRDVIAELHHDHGGQAVGGIEFPAPDRHVENVEYRERRLVEESLHEAADDYPLRQVVILGVAGGDTLYLRSIHSRRLPAPAACMECSRSRIAQPAQ
jgi:hypothetical protein